tara:strand:- start:153 stop:575 length:423 start_codon:yes stop_codon:yes gene_type:complete
MKIGLSYSRCIRDIIDGKVAMRDVLVIVARTDFDPRDDEQWRNIWEGYGGGSHPGGIWSNPEWAGYDDEDKFREVTLELYNTGKLHQPRQFGSHANRMNNYWLDCVVPQDEMTPAQQKAWDNYQLITGLTKKPVEFNDNF